VCLQVGHWEEALTGFRDMLGPGSSARPTASTFNTVMTAFMRNGQYDKVRVVLMGGWVGRWEATVAAGRRV
jgi:hypothetical protein